MSRPWFEELIQTLYGNLIRVVWEVSFAPFPRQASIGEIPGVHMLLCT